MSRMKPRTPTISSWIVVGMMACLLLPSCASTGQQNGGVAAAPSVLPRTAEAPQAVSGERPMVPSIAQEVPATTIEEELETIYDPGRTYNLTVRDTDVRAVLLAIARESDMSIVIEPDVEGAVTNDIRGVTLPVLLDSLLVPLGLEYRVENGVLKIRSYGMETRLFFVDIVQTDRTGTRSIGVSTGQQGNGGGFVGGGGGGLGGGGFGGQAGGGGSSSVQSTDPSFVWDDITEGVLFLMGGGYGGVGGGFADATDPEDLRRRRGATGGGFGFGGGIDQPALHVNRSAGTIMVRHYPGILDEIGEYLASVEEIVQRQVLIEAQIVEVTLREEFSAGVDWSTVFNDLGLSAAQNVAATGSNIFQLSLERGDVNAVLGALENQGEVNVLSSPSVVTMNNQVALLSVGSQEVYFSTTTIIDPTTGRIIATTTQPQTVTNGVILSVTPQISADGWVTMSIQPAVTERTGEAVSREGERFPVMDVRVADNVIRVREMDTIFIGGLLSDVLRQTKTKTPILGDIPGIGFLFRRTEISNRKSDLIIMITPTILSGQRVRELMRDQIQRIESRRRTRPKFNTGLGS